MERAATPDDPGIPGRRYDRDRDCFTGKVSEVIFNCFGDFEGFVLATCEKCYRFKTTENGIKDLVLVACKERLLITVCVSRECHGQIREIIVRCGCAWALSSLLVGLSEYFTDRCLDVFDGWRFSQWGGTSDFWRRGRILLSPSLVSANGQIPKCCLASADAFYFLNNEPAPACQNRHSAPLDFNQLPLNHSPSQQQALTEPLTVQKWACAKLSSGKLPILRATLAIQEKGADQKRGISIQETDFAGMEARVPLLLTPGAAETLAVKIYRLVRTSQCSPLDSLRSCLTVYQNPVPLETLEFQIRLAAVEASDLEFVPMAFRNANISATGRRNP